MSGGDASPTSSRSIPARVYEATWGRMFAALYDRGMRSVEIAGLTEMRRDLLSSAHGQTVEIGAGTGKNLTLYPDSVTGLTLIEPSPHMASRLRERAANGQRDTTIHEASASNLPLADDSADTVVFTLVLCTVPDPTSAISEAIRILRPGGSILFLEHVRSEDPHVAKLQDRVEKPWRFFGGGCHCNRDTLANLVDSGLHIERVEHRRMPKAASFVRPVIQGRATLAG